MTNDYNSSDPGSDVESVPTGIYRKKMSFIKGTISDQLNRYASLKSSHEAAEMLNEDLHKKIDQLVLDHQKTLNEKDQTINRLSKELRINKDINKQTDETNQTLSIRVNDLENAVVESKENGRVLKNNV